MPFWRLSRPPNIEKLKAQEDISKLIEALNRKDKHGTSAKAAIALSEIAANTDFFKGKRSRVIRALGAIDDPKSINSLLVLLNMKDFDLFRELVTSIQKVSKRNISFPSQVLRIVQLNEQMIQLEVIYKRKELAIEKKRASKKTVQRSNHSDPDSQSMADFWAEQTEEENAQIDEEIKLDLLQFKRDALPILRLKKQLHSEQKALLPLVSVLLKDLSANPD